MQRKRRWVSKDSPKALIQRHKASFEELLKLKRQATCPATRLQLEAGKLTLLAAIRDNEAAIGGELEPDALRFWLKHSDFDWWNAYYKHCVRKAQADRRKAQAYIKRTQYALRIMRSLRNCTIPPQSPPQSLPALRTPPQSEEEELPPLHPEWVHPRSRPRL